MSIEISGKIGIDITGIRYASNLRTLTLEKCGVTSEWIEKYLDEINCTNIVTLRLPENQITELSFLDRLHRMSEIDLSYNQITDFTKAQDYADNAAAYGIFDFYYVGKIGRAHV